MRSLLVLTVAVFFVIQSAHGRKEERNKKVVNIIYSLIDVNDDGEISNAELANTFAKYDADGNQKIDRKEFTKTWQIGTGASVAECMAAFSLMDADKNGVMDDHDIQVLYKTLDEDNNGKLNDREFIRKFGQLLNDVPYVIMFTRGDKNRDGVTSEDEFDKIFSLFDTNEDGTVDAAEFVNLWVERQYNDVQTAKRLYGKLDVNGDDKLDRKNDMGALFSILDVDADSVITQDEFVEGWEKIVRSISKRP